MKKPPVTRQTIGALESQIRKLSESQSFIRHCVALLLAKHGSPQVVDSKFYISMNPEVLNPTILTHHNATGEFVIELQKPNHQPGVTP